MLKFSLNNIKWMYFVNLLITIMIKLYKTFVVKVFDFNNLIIKSIIKIHGNFFYEILNNFMTCVLSYRLYFECLFFNIIYILQCIQ